MDPSKVAPPPLYKTGGFEMAMRVAKRVPRPASRFIGGLVSDYLYARQPDAQKALRANLQVVTSLQGAALDRLCARNAHEFGRMLGDYFHCTHASETQIRGAITHWEGMENLQAARDLGRGIVLVTAHLGNWELGALVLATDRIPMTIVTAEEPSTDLTAWRKKYRERLGIRTVTVGADRFAFVDMMAALRRGECLAMLVDRPQPGSGSPVQLFGLPTEFSSGPALLHHHTGAAVVPAYVVQTGSTGYRAFIESAIEMSTASDAAGAVATNTQKIADRFGAVIRQYPEQWFNYVPIWPDNSSSPSTAAS